MQSENNIRKPYRYAVTKKLKQQSKRARKQKKRDTGS